MSAGQILITEEIMPETDTSEKNPLHVSEEDDNLKELSPHGSFELPVETYT